jgi:hypothetical protein
MFAFTMTLLLFNLGAGSYYHFAIMAIYWLLIGYTSAGHRRTSEQTAELEQPARSQPGRAAPAPGASHARMTDG